MGKFKQKSKRTIQLTGKFIDKITMDNVSAYSAQTAFFIILSMFPFCILLMHVLQYTSLTEETLLHLCQIYLPETFEGYVIGFLDEIYSTNSRAFVSVYIITALWLASQGFVSMFAGLNSVYDVQQRNNYFKVRLLSIFYTLVFIVIVIGCLTLLVFGNTIANLIIDHFPALQYHVNAVISMRVTLIGSIMLFLFMSMYKIMPNRKASLLAQFPGALFSTTGWLVFSFIYAFYIDNISNYASIYGTMTTIAFLMIWLYACMFIIFIGGAINHVIQTKPVFKRFRDALPKFLFSGDK